MVRGFLPLLGLPEEGDLSFGRVCGFFLVCSMPGAVEIQSGSNRDPVGVQSGSSRDPVVIQS